MQKVLRQLLITVPASLFRGMIVLQQSVILCFCVAQRNDIRERTNTLPPKWLPPCCSHGTCMPQWTPERSWAQGPVSRLQTGLARWELMTGHLILYYIYDITLPTPVNLRRWGVSEDPCVGYVEQLNHWHLSRGKSALTRERYRRCRDMLTRPRSHLGAGEKNETASRK